MKKIIALALLAVGLAGQAVAGSPNAEPTGLNSCDLQARGVTIASNDSGCLQISGGFSYRASTGNVPNPYTQQPSEKQRVTGTTGRRNDD